MGEENRSEKERGFDGAIGGRVEGGSMGHQGIERWWDGEGSTCLRKVINGNILLVENRYSYLLEFVGFKGEGGGTRI